MYHGSIERRFLSDQNCFYSNETLEFYSLKQTTKRTIYIFLLLLHLSFCRLHCLAPSLTNKRRRMNELRDMHAIKRSQMKWQEQINFQSDLITSKQIADTNRSKSRVQLVIVKSFARQASNSQGRLLIFDVFFDVYFTHTLGNLVKQSDPRRSLAPEWTNGLLWSTLEMKSASTRIGRTA